MLLNRSTYTRTSKEHQKTIQHSRFLVILLENHSLDHIVRTNFCGPGLGEPFEEL